MPGRPALLVAAGVAAAAPDPETVAKEAGWRLRQTRMAVPLVVVLTQNTAVTALTAVCFFGQMVVAALLASQVGAAVRAAMVAALHSAATPTTSLNSRSIEVSAGPPTKQPSVSGGPCLRTFRVPQQSSLPLYTLRASEVRAEMTAKVLSALSMEAAGEQAALAADLA